MDERDSPERLAADFGLWAGSYTRSELPQMRAHAAAFLADVKARPNSPEAGVAHRLQGITHWFAGEFFQARDHLERALALFQSGRDDDLAYRFGMDPGVPAMAYLGFTLWPLGEIERAVSLVERARERLASLTHAHTLALGAMHVGMFELMRGDHSRARIDVANLALILREHDLRLFRAFGVFLEGWATVEDGAPAEGLEDMRRGVELLREQNALVFDAHIKLILAEAEADAGDADGAIAIIDEALATAERTGSRSFEAELRRVRGEVLARRGAPNCGLAGDAFRAAIAVAKQQGARTFELRAALSLAKLHQSTGRPVDAHAVLASALEGFAPTPEMPEIAEAQALLAALAETEEVKAGVAQQQRRLHLHVAYGNALIAARGGGAQETTEAFTRARESALLYGDASERMAIHFGLWIGGYVRGELPSMRAEAAAFLSEVKARPDSPEAGVAHRVTGITQQFAGEYVEARDHLEKALALFRPGRDDDLAFRFGQDAGISAMGNLAHVLWPLGEFDRAIALVDQMQTRIIGLTHARALSFARLHTAFELMRGDHSRAARSAVELARLAREHDLTMYRSFGVFLEGWTKAGDGTPGCGLEDMRRGVDLLREQNVLMFDGIIKIALAEAEAQAGDVDRAIAILDEALATVDRLGYRAFEAELHRALGDTLLVRDPVNPAPAEGAFLTALAVAKQQGTRSFELRTALSLAKLYQSTGRAAGAHAILGPALHGFSPTAEFPEIEEALEFVAAIEGSAQF
jgi:tetratricopeptide (TPR) repeat protein